MGGLAGWLADRGESEKGCLLDGRVGGQRVKLWDLMD